MKVCDKSVYALEFIGRIDEYIRVPLVLGNILIKGRHTFQCTAGGGAHCDDSAAAALGLVDEIGSLLGQEVMLAVHFVIEDVVLLYGTEGTQSHMKGDEGGLYTP